MRLAVWTVAALLAAASAPARAEGPRSQQSARSAPQARLVRVLGGGQQALVLDRNQGAYVLLRVGDRLQGMRVTEIGDQQLVLAHADGRRHYVLPLVPLERVETDSAAPFSAPAADAPPIDPYGSSAQRPSASAAPPIDPYVSSGKRPATSAAPPIDPYRSSAQRPSASAAPPIDPYRSSGKRPAASAAPPIDPYSSAQAPQDPYLSSAAPSDPYGSGAAQPIPSVKAPPASRVRPEQPKSEARPGSSLAPPVVRRSARRDAATERRTLSRRELDAALADFAALGKEMQLRVVPDRGVAIVDLSRGSLAHRIGLRAGDLVLTIAGRRITSADDAAAAYVALDRTDRFAVVVERAGRRHTLQIALTP